MIVKAPAFDPDNIASPTARAPIKSSAIAAATATPTARAPSKEAPPAAAKPGAAPAAKPLPEHGTLEARRYAAADMRKAAAQIRTLSGAAVAAASLGIDAKEAVALCEQLAVGTLEKMGVDVEDDKNAWMLGTMLSAAAEIVADVAASGVPRDQLLAEAKTIAAAMVAAVRSKTALRIIDKKYPNEIDAVSALRISNVAALSMLACEMHAFNFFGDTDKMIREAATHLASGSIAALQQMVPQDATVAVSTMAAQSLMRAGGRIYAACWRSEARVALRELNALPDAQLEVAAARMGTEAPAIADRIAGRFADGFAKVVEATIEEIAPAASAATAKPKPSAKPTA